MKKIICITALLSVLTTAPVYATDLYKVRQGDTLWDIADKAGISVQIIVEANPLLQNPDNIYPGQTLTIPLDGSGKAFENSLKTAVISQEDKLYSQEILNLINKERVSAGKKELLFSDEALVVAKLRAQEMADNQTLAYHSTSENIFQLFALLNTIPQAVSENTARGFKTPDDIVRSWIDSDPHNLNIFHDNVTHIGVGASVSPDGQVYVSQVLVKFD